MKRTIIVLAMLALTISACRSPEEVIGIPTKPATTTMYFCGYDRCKDSGEYGQLVFRTGITLWNNRGPDRGGVCRTANHGERASVVRERRVDPGPGGLWYKLEDGCWTNVLWITEKRCDESNLAGLSFKDCLMGEY